VQWAQQTQLLIIDIMSTLLFYASQIDPVPSRESLGDRPQDRPPPLAVAVASVSSALKSNSESLDYLEDLLVSEGLIMALIDGGRGLDESAYGRVKLERAMRYIGSRIEEYFHEVQ